MAPMTAVSHADMNDASPWVRRFAPLIPPGEVLDLACGGGRHARLLASLGYQVLASDRDAGALARTRGPGIATLQADFETGPAGWHWPFPAARFSGVVVTNYLHRPLFPHIIDSLMPGGLLIHETFALGNERFGKPSNPAFLLAPGELLKVAEAAAMRVLAFEDGLVAQPRPAMLQRICAVKPPYGDEAATWRLDR
jgi:SAM-dependent methyltransferase